MTVTACIMADPTRRWVKGTEYIEPADEYSRDGTIIGVATNERIVFARACGVAFASPLPPEKPVYDEEFWRDYLAH
jgi:hypothetical protein